MKLKNVNEHRKRKLARDFGQEIDEVPFQDGGVCTSIYLDKSCGRFTAVIGDEEFGSKDLAEVRNWAVERLEAYCKLTWTPVIMVYNNKIKDTNYGVNSRRLELHSISIDVMRQWVAVLDNGDVRAVSWDTPEKQRLSSQAKSWEWVYHKIKVEPGRKYSNIDRSRPYLPSELPVHEDKVSVLPYSEPMWTGLMQLCQSIDELSLKLEELIRSKDGQEKLLAIGSRLLGLLEAPK